MGTWTLDDIPWDSFDRAKLDPELVRIVKAASLVEYNGGAYAGYLCRVFAEDADFQISARKWGDEEVQHGAALGRWAELADPSFNFAAAFARFQAGYRIDFGRDISARGSRSGEMIARCIVETGTSNYYTALRDAADEPVLREICRHIAADELRHYRMFYKQLDRCLAREGIGRVQRLRVALGRIAESEDDELAYAYYAANGEASVAYDRRHWANHYARRAYGFYRRHHIQRAIAMVLKAAGLSPQGWLNNRLTSAAAWFMGWRIQRLVRAGF
jgi:hypothetical protein